MIVISRCEASRNLDFVFNYKNEIPHFVRNDNEIHFETTSTEMS